MPEEDRDVAASGLEEQELKARIDGELRHDLSTLEIGKIDEFPMTPTGKVAKATLRENAARAGT